MRRSRQVDQESSLQRARTRTGARLFRGLLIASLRRLGSGTIILHEGGEERVLGRSDQDDLCCRLTVHDPRFFRAVVLGGSIGAGESYMAGHWTVDDLTVLIRILARDRQLNQRLDGGFVRLRQLIDRLAHRLRPNTLPGSRRNIARHYDLGNEFFQAFLDPTMSYSCGIFDRAEATMEQASTLKNDLVCRKLQLGPDDELLEIGTGWGGLAIHAARHFGCRVVTTTISRNQYEYAADRIRREGLQDRIELRRDDYRDLPRTLNRPFSKLVSIEMIEAVGHAHLERYFDVCGRMLAPNGSMLLQSIVIADQQFDSYRRSADFIQRYIFPGGCLPSVTALCRAMTRSSDLRLTHLHDITQHYATTLERWRENFRSAKSGLSGLGLPGSFLRMWEFYFCYCEAGFRERTVGDVQLLLTRPMARVAGVVPQT